MTHRLMDGDCTQYWESNKEDKIDYVVMGTEGAAGWSTFVGTNTVQSWLILKCLLLYSRTSKI
jgi:hypothetical protein